MGKAQRNLPSCGSSQSGNRCDSTASTARSGWLERRVKALGRSLGGRLGSGMGALLGRDRTIRLVGQAVRSLLHPFDLTVMESASLWETGENDLLLVRRLRDSSLRMLLDPRDHVVSQGILRQGDWEPHVMEAMREFLRPGASFVDIGANLGYYSLRVAHEHVDASVHAFEPFPANFQILQGSIRLNGLEGRIRAYPVACSDEDRTVWIAGADWTSGGKGILQGDQPDPTWPSMRVEARRLDAFAPNLKADLVKVDVEGHEPQVLRGMWQTIQRERPALITELGLEGLRLRGGGEGLQQMLAPLLSLGYAVDYLLPTERVPCGQDLERVARVCEETGGLGEALLRPSPANA